MTRPMSATASDPARTASAHPPTHNTPEHGTILLGDIVLSHVAYWPEDGMHVFRSEEYDVLAAAESMEDAVRVFVQKSEDYAKFLSDADPTPDDLRLANVIYGRLADGWESICTRRV